MNEIRSPEFCFAVDEVGTTPSYYVQHMDNAVLLPIGIKDAVPNDNKRQNSGHAQHA
jgi:hypothetical protein